MGNKDFIKAILERQGKVHFGRVRLWPYPLHLCGQLEQERNQLWVLDTVALDHHILSFCEQLHFLCKVGLLSHQVCLSLANLLICNSIAVSHVLMSP